MSDFKVSNSKERILCYAAAILTAKISQPGNPYSVVAQMKASIEEAQELIKRVYELPES